MTGRGRTRATDRASAIKYRQTAQTFLRAATDLDTLAGDEEHYGNAIALLAVHAAIAWADTVTIAYDEIKSTGEHAEVAGVLRSVLGNRLPNESERALLALVSAKDSIAYQGKYYPLEEARSMLKRANLFATWAERMYQERPG